ncbi:MAG: c-type cytochrome, partial [Flavobacteriaceae bacterium]
MHLFQKLVQRLLVLMISFSLLIVVILIGLMKYQPTNDGIETTPPENLAIWDANTLVLNNPNVTKQVKEGYRLVAESSKYMGPLAEDKSLQFAGNNLSCTNCHLNGGTQSGSASWIGIVGRFPQFGGRANATGTLEDRINGCMERSMNGKKFPPDAPQIQAMIAYMKWLDEGIPKLNEKIFKGYPNIELPNQAVNLSTGKEIYVRECALCHGSNGQGVRYLNEKEGYQYPPLWGSDSYNNGAGMHRVITAAAFIKNNMPYLQASWDNPKLSDEEA